VADGRQRGDYTVGPGRPPLHTRFKKGRSGNPGGRSTKSLPELLADALDETVVVTIDSRRHVAQIGDLRHALVGEALDLFHVLALDADQPGRAVAPRRVQVAFIVEIRHAGL
jgi:uncharacterized protein DUF5681